MDDLILVKHAQGAPGLRFYGLGPRLLPSKGLKQLQCLLDNNTIWARKRNRKDIKTMLSHSNVIISLWMRRKLIGFGRATTDQIYRAVLWDIVVDNQFQECGYGTIILNAILNNKSISKVERIYLMTTNCQDFYIKKGFNLERKQKLLFIKNTN